MDEGVGLAECEECCKTNYYPQITLINADDKDERIKRKEDERTRELTVGIEEKI